MMATVDFAHGTALAQAAYRQATSLGQLLETVDSFRPPAIDFEAAAHAAVPNSLTEVSRALFHDRQNGSRFLSSADWAALDRARASWPGFAPVDQCRNLREPWQAGSPEQRSKIVLLDARTLQLPHMNGTKNHALALTRAFAAELPPHHDLAFFTSPRLPALEQEIAALATVDWRSGLIGDVEVYVQLATVMDPSDPTNLDLLRAPWIRRVSVFLDDIKGLHPAHFIGTNVHFWEHQVTVEKMRPSDVVLTLGQASNEEAMRLWDSLEEGERRPAFVITSCQSGLGHVATERTETRTNEFLVFGNHLPHKNVALVAVASSLIHVGTTGQPLITFVAAISPVLEDAIRRVADHDGVDESQRCLQFEANLSSEELSRRLSRSRGVIVPSLHEGFSLPVIEAIERGVPVALSRIPAHQELLPEGPWFFDPRSVESLLSAVRSMGEADESWASIQSAHLAERYRPSTMVTAVRESLSTLTNDAPLRRAQPSGAVPHETARSRHETAAGITLNRLHMRDTQLVTMLLARPHVDETFTSAPKNLPSFKHVHDAVVAEFHRSLTWRAGRVVTAPLRWLRSLRGKIS
jgi:glycosyltransferase involved in cell wall biosynthesis